MASYEDEQQKLVELDLSNVPRELQSDVKAEVGAYIIDEILTRVANGESPVVGETFDKLNKKYAEKMKGGNRTPNLELEGDLLQALGFSQVDDGIVVGIMDKSQRPKADGHNHFTKASSRATAPKRRFIPGEDQNFRREIRTGIKEIVSQYEQINEQPNDLTTTGETSPSGGISVTFNDLLSRETIAQAILRRLNGR